MWRLAELALALRARHRPRGRLFWVRSRKQLFGAPERTAESDRLLACQLPRAASPLTAKSRRCSAVLECPLLARPRHSVAAHYRRSVRLLQESIELLGD